MTKFKNILLRNNAVCPQIQSCQFIFIPSFIFSLLNIFSFLEKWTSVLRNLELIFTGMGQIPHHCGFLVSHSSWFLSKFLNSNLLPGHQRLSIVASKPQSLVTTHFYSLLFHNGMSLWKKIQIFSKFMMNVLTLMRLQN